MVRRSLLWMVGALLVLAAMCGCGPKSAETKIDASMTEESSKQLDKMPSSLKGQESVAGKSEAQQHMPEGLNRSGPPAGH